MSAFHRVSGDGMATAAFFCGLAGIVLAAAAGVWVLFEANQVQPEEGRPHGEMVLMSLAANILGIATLCCGVLGIVFGAMSTSRARKAGEKPLARGRLGLYLGIAALALLLVIFIYSVLSFWMSFGGKGGHMWDRRYAALAHAIISLS